MAEQRRSIVPTDHVDDRTMAAYIDGRLTGPAKAAVTAHIAECHDCHFIFAESARLRLETEPEPESWPRRVGSAIAHAWHSLDYQPQWVRPAVVTAGLAAAASLTFVVQPQLARLWPGRSDVAELVAAVGTERHFEPRLTGGFEYGAVSQAPVVRGEASEDRLPPEVRMAALKLEQRLKSERNASTLRAYAAAQMVMGHADKAVPPLEEAARMSPHDPHIESDLAAAYLVRFKNRNNLEDVTRAVAAATDARDRDPKLREAQFNLALALEALSLREEARKAWQRYLEIDGSSPWSAEARQHLENLAPDKQSKRFEEEKRQIVDAAASGNAAIALAAVKRLPDVAYEYVENELIPAWADAWLARDRARADEVLARARLIAASLTDAVGERMPSDVVANIDAMAASTGSADDAMAHAVLAFRDARVRYEAADISGASSRFAAAAAVFSTVNAPWSQWTTLYASIVDYYNGQLAAAGRPLDALLDAASRRGYVTLRGRALRMRGLVRGVGGDLAGSLDDYHAAWSAFNRIGARQDVAAIHTSLAERYETLGESTLSWHHLLEALQRLSDVRLAVTRHNVLLFANVQATRAGEMAAALAFESELLSSSRDRSTPADMAELYLRRASTYHELGNRDRAREDIEEALAWAAKIGDPALTRRWQAEAELTRGEIAGGGDGTTQALRSSLAYFERAGMTQRLARVYLALGTSELSAGRRNEAAAAFKSGLQVLERQRSQLPSGQLRLSYFDQPWQLYDATVDLLSSDSPTVREALRVAEQARARDLRDGTVGPSIDDPSSLAADLSADEAVLYYGVLANRVVGWTITNNRTTFASNPVRRDDLAVVVGDLLAALREHRQGDADRQAETLYRLIVQPFIREATGITRLIIVPHGILHNVPFAALRNPDTKRYFIEDHAIVVAPSATIFARASSRLRTTPPLQSASVFVVANPATAAEDDVPPLLSAEREGRDIQALFPRTRLVSGRDATKDAFLASAGRYDIVHFAGHAIANDRYPPLSRLVLARDSGGNPGTVFAHELQSTPLDHTSMVVLAACSTAVGVVRNQEGAINLARPFLARGVPVVIATLWDVDDAASEALFRLFYASLRAGASPGAALRDAQLALLHNPDPALRPAAAWAGFVYFGSDLSAAGSHTS